MNVQLAGYGAVSILRGGPLTQITRTADHLRLRGVNASLFDPWKPFDRGSADLVHLFGANIGTYHLARELAALNVPLVVSPIVYSNHSAAFVRTGLAVSNLFRKGWRGLWSDYGLCAEICGWANRVLPNTEDEAGLLVRGFGVDRTRVTVVPNGVDASFEHGDPSLFRTAYGLDRFVLNVGHIGHERKNVLRLIQALGQIDHPAVIIGRIIAGPYGDACVREAAKYPHIRLIDGLEPGSPMLASAYAACSLFVLPSLFETPGIAALEAGLAGAKIVITDRGGTKEYFGTHAVYVDPGSVSSIRDGIRRGLAMEKGGELREHIRANYLWEGVARRTAEAYAAVLDGRSK
jgi:glycosyltransferase involved in cell wall biosynthesis